MMYYKNRVLVLVFFTSIAWLAPGNLLAEYPSKRELLMNLLQLKSIRNELNFTPEQTMAFVKVYQHYRQKIDEGRKKCLEMINNGKDKKEADSEFLLPIYKASDESFKQVLNPDQIKRIGEIQNQQQGYPALAEPTVIQSLALTDEQKKLFKSIANDAKEEVSTYERDFRKRFPSAFYSQELGEAMTAGMMLIVTVDRWALKMMVSHLTDKQKQAWQELLGKPFTIPAHDPGIGPELDPQK